MSEEATIHPDGSTTMNDIPNEDTTGFTGAGEETFENTENFDGAEGETFEEVIKEAKGIDPAFYLLFAVALVIGLYYYFVLRKKNEQVEDDFFSNLDGEKFNLKLPSEVEEYYAVREQCEKQGWKPGERAEASQATGPHRVIAQALMKRAMADVPLVQHIQKESAGMNKLYSQSMCSVKQWKSYQAAEALVTAEIDEVRAEADEIEPGWSGVIWKQAMQYHEMLKKKHEQEAKQAEELAKKRKDIEEAVAKAKAQADKTPEEKEDEARKAAEELLKMEEREKDSKEAFKSGMKKGFLDKKGKKK